MKKNGLFAGGAFLIALVSITILGCGEAFVMEHVELEQTYTLVFLNYGSSYTNAPTVNTRDSSKTYSQAAAYLRSLKFQDSDINTIMSEVGTEFYYTTTGNLKFSVTAFIDSSTIVYKNLFVEDDIDESLIYWKSE
ncbi:hypothetical protein FACS1894151_02610 [Spirochaetia bacterium]|nr:hypothetical protein FACS1894151_02610 [Spirochaetia bacterium]